MTCCEHYNGDDIQYECMKYQTKMCPDCAACKDPELYCKFRPSCMIYFMEKESARKKRSGAR